MKKVLLIARAKSPGSVQKADLFADKMRQLLGNEDIQIENCEITELFFEVAKDKIGIYHPEKKFDVRDFDLVIMRHTGKCWVEAQAIARYCERFDVRYTDTYLDRLLLDSKLSNEFLLWCNGITQWPWTMYGPVDELVRRLPELGDKAVFKDSNGSKGRLNFVVSTPDEIRAIVRQYPDVQFVLQEFIPNDSDLRILIMNKHVSMIIRRTGDGSSHLNNTSQGGDAELVSISEVDSKIIDLSLKAAHVAKLQVAGVDVMFDARNNDFYFLEINNAPQISSGTFTAEKSTSYAQMIQSLLEVELVQ